VLTPLKVEKPTKKSRKPDLEAAIERGKTDCGGGKEKNARDPGGLYVP